MKAIITTAAVLVMMILPGSGYPAEQQMGGQAQEQGQPPSHHPMMGMMCPMMSGMSGMGGMSGGMGMMPGMMGGQMGGRGMGGMGMMGGSQADPKTMGKMLQFRGELLKAMGEVMMKHGEAMEQAK